MTAASSEPTALYRWFDADDRLLYVGVSCNPMDRTNAHFKGSAWFTNARSATLEWFPTRERALAAEVLAIRGETPLRNRVLYRGETRHRTVRVAEDVWRSAAERAATEDKTLTDVIVAALKRYGRPRREVQR